MHKVERGEADWSWIDQVSDIVPASERARRLREYGINKRRYFVVSGRIVGGLALNMARPLFRNNTRLRQAVNFGVDRAAILRAYGARWGNATDQIVPPSIPGFRDAQIYPLEREDLGRAKALARGRTRGGKAVLYVVDQPIHAAAAAVIRANLQRIGIDVQIKRFPPSELAIRLLVRDEPFDLLYRAYLPTYADPDNYLLLLDGRESINPSHFNSARFNRDRDRANRLAGEARHRALGELDIRLVRDEAPVVPLWNQNLHVLVTDRVGCLVFNGHQQALNLGAVCLK